MAWARAEDRCHARSLSARRRLRTRDGFAELGSGRLRATSLGGLFSVLPVPLGAALVYRFAPDEQS